MRDLDRQAFRSMLVSMPFEQRDALLVAVLEVGMTLGLALAFSVDMAISAALDLTEQIAEYLDAEIADA